MEIPTAEDDYEKAKRQAKLFYQQMGPVWCPVLGEHIFFTSFGFRHLMRKKAMFRSKDEQRERFRLLAEVPRILGMATEFLYEKRLIVRKVKSRGRWYFGMEMLTIGYFQRIKIGVL